MKTQKGKKEEKNCEVHFTDGTDKYHCSSRRILEAYIHHWTGSLYYEKDVSPHDFTHWSDLNRIPSQTDSTPSSRLTHRRERERGRERKRASHTKSDSSKGLTMTDKNDESTKLFTNYVTYNGEVESPAASAESANESFIDSGEAAGGGGRIQKGLTMGLGAMFLIGEMAGAGVLNLPRAIANTWWVGVPLMVLLCAAVGFAGTRLALCWVLLEEQWPEYRAPCRRPYPAIAYRALGRAGQVIAEIAMGLTLFGATTVYLLLASQISYNLLSHLAPTVSQCAWILIIGFILTPFSWLGSPKDFKLAPILAAGATFIACLVVIVVVIVQKEDHDPPIFPKPSFNSFFLGFGSILFSLGGASIFPTVQNDMKNRSDFPRSVVVTFLVLLALYLPVSIISYGILGDNGVKDNILQSVSGAAVMITNVFLLCHFLFAFVIVVNPVDQTIEGLLNFPSKLGVRRCVLRTVVMLVIMVVGMAVPEFSKILDLVGGSTVTLMSFVFPPICYLRLSAIQRSDGLPLREVRPWEKALLYVVIVLGVTGGAASSWSAMNAILSPDSFRSTCFSSSTFFA